MILSFFRSKTLQMMLRASVAFCCSLFLLLGTSPSFLVLHAAEPTSVLLAQASRSRTTRAPTPPRPVNTWYGFVDPLENATIPEVINKLTRFALGIVGALFLLYFIYGGFMWMTAAGEAERVKKATQTLSQSIIGIAIVVFSYSIIGFILQLTNQLQTTRTP